MFECVVALQQQRACTSWPGVTSTSEAWVGADGKGEGRFERTAGFWNTTLLPQAVRTHEARLVSVERERGACAERRLHCPVLVARPRPSC